MLITTYLQLMRDEMVQHSRRDACHVYEAQVKHMQRASEHTKYQNARPAQAHRRPTRRIRSKQPSLWLCEQANPLSSVATMDGVPNSVGKQRLEEQTGQFRCETSSLEDGEVSG